MKARAARPGAIAVIGLGCRYPGARSPRELWENILSRRQEFRSFRNERMPAADYFDAAPDAPDKTYGRLGAFIDGYKFDPSAWRVPKSTVESADIAHWLALDVAAAALADAGYAKGERLPKERTAVILGNSLTGEQTRAEGLRLRWPFIRRLLREEGLRQLPAAQLEALLASVEQRYLEHFVPITEDTLAGALSNTIAGRICGAFDFGGGGYVVDGACASSMLAVCTAASALEEGRADVALAGGVDISMDPFELVGFAKTRALTPDAMRVYDRRGNGFIPGEGCGFVVLRRLEDARAANDSIYAVIEGWGVSSDGKNAITAPRVSGQARAIREAWSRSGLPDIVEGHGTGTAVGDKVELEALATVLGELSEGEPTGRPIGVTSLKSIIGHTKAAAGIGAFLKAVLAANRRVLPPTSGYAEPNPVFSSTAKTLFPIQRGQVRGAGRSLRVGASAMGFGGINTHAVVVSEGAPDARIAPQLDERALLATGQETELFVFGAASHDALRAQLARLLPIARDIARSELPDLSALLLSELPAAPRVRAAILASTPEELTTRLSQVLTSGRSTSSGPFVWLDTPTAPPRLGFLFPGQGSQQLGSARRLLARSAELREVAERLFAVAAEEGCTGLREALYPDIDVAVQDDERAALQRALNETKVAQPALCLTSHLWALRLQDLGLTPVAVAGHSMGELSALAAAGAVDVATILRVSVHRGEVMSSADGNGGMTSVAAAPSTVEAMLGAISGYAVIANINTPSQVVVAGELGALAALEEECARRGVNAKRLPVSNGFHSELVAGAAASLRANGVIPEVSRAPTLRLHSSLAEAPIEAPLSLREHVADHVRRPIDFVGLVKRMARDCDVLLEVGSGRVLSGLASAVLTEGPSCFPVEGVADRDSDLHTVLAALWTLGANPRWEALHRGRLIRPFVAPNDRTFIVNPVEARRLPEQETAPSFALVAPVSPPGALAARTVAQGRVVPAQSGVIPAVLDELRRSIAERTGFDVATLTPELRLRDDLNLDSIKAGELVSKTARTFDALSRIDPAQLTSLRLHEIAEAIASASGSLPQQAEASHESRGESSPQPVPAAAPSSRALLDWMLDRVAERTGFERSSLSGELRPQDDLNLDSIKAGEVISAAARQVGVADRVDPAAYVRSTFQEIAASLSMLAGAPSGPAAAAEVATSSRPDRSAPKATTPHQPTQPLNRWVRTFGLRVLPAAPMRAHADARPWAGRRVRLLGPANVEDAVRRGLEAFGAVIDPAGQDVVCVLGATDTRARVAELRRLVDELPHSVESVLLVQRLDGKFGLEQVGSGTAGAAFLRSVSLERPSLKVRILDVASVLPADNLVVALRHAVPTEVGVDSLGIDEHGGLWQLDAAPLDPNTFVPRAEPPRPGELFLVTGGAKGITAACAEALARATRVRLAIVGSTPKDKLDDEVLRFLGRLTSDGHEVRYYSCDLTVKEDVVRLVRAIQAEQGPIAGVLHGAGRNTPRRVEQVSEADALHEIGPKLLGGEWLLGALESAPPRYFLALTSVIGVAGIPGNAWYAFANESLDLKMAEFAARHAGCCALAVAYGVWSSIGMGERLGSVERLAKDGIGAIPPDEGIARFLQVVLGEPGVRQPLVTANLDELPTWPRRMPMDSSLRFTQGRTKGVAGVEARVRLTLHPQRDQFVRDHTFRDSHLLPTVYGLEAMAQVAWLARGGGDAPFVDIRDVTLPFPVVVGKTGTQIEISARVRESEPDTLDCEVRSEASEFARPHFSAVLRYAPRPEVPEKLELPVLPAPEPTLVPLADLYGGLCFQGDLFHRIDAITGGRTGAVGFAGEVRESDGERWLLGDPHFRDAMLQVPHLLASHDDALPIRIARIGIAAGHAAPGPRTGVAYLTESSARLHMGHIDVVNAAGERVAWVEGFAAQILTHFSDRPSTEEVLRPTGRIAETVRQRLAEYCGRANLPVPKVGMWPQHLHELQAADRRAVEQQLITELEPSLRLSWAPDGKPLAGEGRWVSISHDANSCLIAVGSSPVGCDIEEVAPRDWEGLLGPVKTLHRQLSNADGVDRAGARLWAAREALHKAGATDGTLAVVQRADGVVEFQQGAHRVITLPVLFERGPHRVLAFAFAEPSTQRARHGGVAPAGAQELVSAQLHAERGTFETRFVVSFDDSNSVARRVPASGLIVWMGRCRELAIANLRDPLRKALAEANGMVTQHAWATLSGEVTALDRILATSWVEELRPTTCQLRYSFHRLTPDGAPELIGEAGQGFGWVEVLGHGQVRAAPFPPFFHDFLSAIRREEPHHPPSGGTLLLPTGRPLVTVTQATSTLESNVVGNIYYAHYFKWAQRAVDRLVARAVPESVVAAGARGELLVRSMRIEYLREAMPFDDIETSLFAAPAPDGTGERIDFDVVFSKIAPDGERVRLAIGRLDTAWTRLVAGARELLAPPRWTRDSAS